MELVAIVALLALVEYFAMGFLVGRARGRYGVPAPASTGHPVFERTFRAHQNTLEQLPIFLPALFAFAYYVSPGGAALLGLVFVVGRAVYFRGYVADAPKRAPGTFVTLIAQAVLVVGGLAGALVALAR
jgi:uncharacterized membrane protein YecN with MAPEG domain